MTQTSLLELPVLAPPPFSHCEPVAAEMAPANVRGEQANRLMVIFRAPGCAYDLRAGGGCTYCGFRRLTTHGAPVTAMEYITQFDSALRGRDLERDSVRQIDLFNSGNFLNDGEVPAEGRIEILRRCAAQAALRLVVAESRPEYITVSRLEAMQNPIRRHGKLALEIAIGFDAFDPARAQAIRKGITRASFERAVQSLGKTGTDLMTYVLLKPCAMTDEEALTDVRQAAEYVHELAARNGIRARISLEPTFVVPETFLAHEFRAGRYQPPTLDLVMEAASSIAHLGPLNVGLWDEGLNPLAVPSAKPADLPRIVRALKQFNLTQNSDALNWN
jgi:radical SAM enzyme (TIGR01210 family)